MIKKCLQVNPLLRPSAEDLAASPQLGLRKEGESSIPSSVPQSVKSSNLKHKRASSQVGESGSKIELL